MPSPFPGMDPFLEKNPIFQELHTQFLAEAQALLQPQLRPKYVARLERHLTEGAAWGLELEGGSLEGKEPDLVVVRGPHGGPAPSEAAVLARPSATQIETISPEELALRKQRRIVVYVNSRPRIAVAAIELLSPSNKERGSLGQRRYLEKRGSALHSGLHWVEIDLLRQGERPPVPVELKTPFDYMVYVAQATITGWKHQAFAWPLQDPLPVIPIPLLGADQASLDLGACFHRSYDRTAADDEADYGADPPPPPLDPGVASWVKSILCTR